jgi:purine-binding chemotaxis protein CheW
VQDVFEVAEFARLPGAQAPFVGVTAWRGTILTVLDIRPILGIPTAPLADLRFAIVAGSHRPAFGILADAVHDLVSVNAADLLDPPDGVAVHRDYLLGVTRSSLPVLDVERLVQRYG